MRLLHLQLLLVNQTVLWRGLTETIGFLKGPTLVYHDGSDDKLDTVVQSLSASRPVMVAQTPNRLSSDKQQSVRSTVLLTKGPHIISDLRPWQLWTARSRILLILEPASDVREWLSVLWKVARAAKVVAMVLSDPPEYFTWFPYQRQQCSDVTMVTKLDSSTLFSHEVVPPFHSCPLSVVMRIFPPVTVIDEFRGIEPRIYHVLADKLGLETSFVPVPPNYNIWTTIDSVTGYPTNGLKILWDNEGDLLFTNMRWKYEILPYAETLISHTMDTYAFFVPAPRPVPRFTAIYRAFPPAVWVYVITASVTIFALATIIPYVETGCFQPALLKTVAVSLNLPVAIPKFAVFRWLTIIVYIYSLHITTAYQSSLMFFLSNVPREKPIKTLEELADSGLFIQFHDGQRSLVDTLSRESHTFNELSRPNRSTFVALLNSSLVSGPGTSALMSTKITYSARFADPQYFDQFGYPLVACLRERISSLNMVFYMSKGHPLLPLLNRYMLYLIEAGLPEHFADELIKAPPPTLRHLESFDMKNVEGPFLLWAVMVAGCFVVWLVEIARRKVGRYLRFCMENAAQRFPNMLAWKLPY